MWQQNCVLGKFGLLKSCQPITSHRPTDRQNPVLTLAYRSRRLVIWQSGFLTCFCLRKSQLACRLQIRLFPNDLTTCFLPVSLWESPNRPLGWGLAVGRTGVFAILISMPMPAYLKTIVVWIWITARFHTLEIWNLSVKMFLNVTTELRVR